MSGSKIEWKRLDPWRVLIPKTGAMRAEGLVFASEAMMQAMGRDDSLAQVANVAHLPGIVGRSMAMPDIHWGYGFPIGGVAAFDAKEGVVSPGGVGYDINCGVRLLRTPFTREEIVPRLQDLVSALFRNIPCGVGSRRKDLRLGGDDEARVLSQGASWAVERGMGEPADVDNAEEGGCLRGADPAAVGERARDRGREQLGTLGSGNHFVEIGWVDQVFDEAAAAAFGLSAGRVTVMIHTGSRGLGHQVCEDSIRTLLQASRKYGIELPDRQLCAAPLESPEGRKYLAAMAAAANYAFANRTLIAHWVRETFAQVLGSRAEMPALYDVAHNIAKMETHVVDGEQRALCVHRKGATRAFGPGHPAVPEAYRAVGQPVLIPGDMGRCSFVLAGTQAAMETTFGSSCHGAGRRLSRAKAIAEGKGRNIARELEEASGVRVRAASRETLAEEMPSAYKDVSEVVDVVQGAGIGRKVARIRPMGVIKG
jgi:tRNA-splicing ligase RtcB